MCWGVLGTFDIFDCVAECVHINLWSFCRRTASAGATAAATFGAAAAVLLLIFKRVQVGCPRAQVGTDRDCNNCDENGGDGDQPHPTRSAEGNECAKEERYASEDPYWAGHDVRAIPGFFRLAYIWDTQTKILISWKATSGS